MARISYVSDDQATPEATAALDEVRQKRGAVSNVARVLVHSPSALRAYEQFSAHVNGTSRLDVKTREVLILRVAQLLGNAFEWRRHVPRALEAGVSTEAIESLATWMDSPSFSKGERAVLALADDHIWRHDVGEMTVRAVHDAYGDELLVEILLALGWYQVLATIILPLDLIADDPEPAGLAVPFRAVSRSVA